MRAPTTCRATRPTWWSARCAAAFDPMGAAAAGPAARAAPTPSRTPAASARRPPRSSAGSCWRVRWSPGDAARRRRGAVPAGRRLEGHPDNVAPALHGGFTISGRDEDGVVRRRLPRRRPGPAVVFVPPSALSTERRPRTAARAGAARRRRGRRRRTALLVAALAGRPEHLLRATRDYLHQEYRRPAMPDSLDLVDRLRADGVAGGRVRRRPDGAGLGRRRGDPALVRRAARDGWASPSRLEVETVRAAGRGSP